MSKQIATALALIANATSIAPSDRKQLDCLLAEISGENTVVQDAPASPVSVTVQPSGTLSARKGRLVNKSAETGKFVDVKTVKEKPATTVRQRTKRNK